MVYDVTDEFREEEPEIKIKNLYELKADLSSSFDTFQNLYTELNDNLYPYPLRSDIFVQNARIYRAIE